MHHISSRRIFIPGQISGGSLHEARHGLRRVEEKKGMMEERRVEEKMVEDEGSERGKL